MRTRVGGGNAIGAVLRHLLRANHCSDCAKIWRKFAESLAAVRHSVCKRALPKGIIGAADSARSVAPIEMKLGTELHLLAG